MTNHGAAFDMRSIWRAILVGSCLHSNLGCFSATWRCKLENFPVENIAPSPAQEESPLEKDGKGGRRLRSQEPDDPLDPSENADGDGRTASEPIALQKGRVCACAMDLFDSKYKYYCPTHTNYCSVSDRYGVTCYEEKDWKVGFARYIWYYLCFFLLVLAIYPIFTTSGRHASKYLLSKCFPRMNAWIAGELLRAEMEAQSIIRADWERAARANLPSSWISGYSLKTKRYSSGECADAEGGAPKGAPRDEGEMDDEGVPCTICFLPLEDGDRVADLGCRHLYHAECLGEWILKKNSCPMCQSPGIAKEIRSFGAHSDDAADAAGDDPAADGVLSRWRRQMRENLSNIATGGSQWTRNLHAYQARMALNEQQ